MQVQIRKPGDIFGGPWLILICNHFLPGFVHEVPSPSPPYYEYEHCRRVSRAFLLCTLHVLRCLHPQSCSIQTSMTKQANASATGSQRKRNTNQSRPNVASQQNSSSTIPQQKKGNKQNHQQNSAKASSPAPTSKPPSPPVPRPEKHVSLLGYNGDEIDNLLSKGIPADANAYKPENPAAQKTGPWGQKRKPHNL